MAVLKGYVRANLNDAPAIAKELWQKWNAGLGKTQFDLDMLDAFKYALDSVGFNAGDFYDKFSQSGAYKPLRLTSKGNKAYLGVFVRTAPKPDSSLGVGDIEYNAVLQKYFGIAVRSSAEEVAKTQHIDCKINVKRVEVLNIDFKTHAFDLCVALEILV